MTPQEWFERGRRSLAGMLSAMRPRVLDAGIVEVPPIPGVGTTPEFDQMVFQWQGDLTPELTLHLEFLYNGVRFNAAAGGSGGATGYVDLTYGAGNNVRTVRFDMSAGSIQLPPCDYVRVRVHFSFISAVATFPFVAKVALAEGTFPVARVPYFSMSALVTAGSFITVPRANNEKSIDIQVRPFPAALPPVYPLPTLVVSCTLWDSGTNRFGEVIYRSMDGSSNYPLSNPVALQDITHPLVDYNVWRFDHLAGATNAVIHAKWALAL